ncbi:MAG: VOC family protein [Pseudobacteriovorax sp.]|nr:VOC family protein [Pseudobacteriovorax sp.]
MTFFQNPQIVRYETGSKTETAVREFLIRDPDGYILRFVEKPFLPDSPVSVEGIDHFVLTVGNIKKTIAFYQSTLGMKPVEFKKGRWALLFGNQKINLHAADNIPDKNVKKATPGSADFCLTTWIPLERVIENLQQLSVPIIEGPGPRTGACEAIESIYICDPDENLVEICRPTLE